MQPKAHRLLVLAALALIAVASLEKVTTSASAATKPCWQLVLEDWSDGAISDVHPVTCYREALQRMPEDVRLYSSATDDIRRALAARVHSTRGVAGIRPTTPVQQVAPAATAGGGGGVLPEAPLVLAGTLAGIGMLAAGAAVAWHRRSRRSPESRG